MRNVSGSAQLRNPRRSSWLIPTIKNLIMVLARKAVRARFHRHRRDIGHDLRGSLLPWAKLIRYHRRERRMGRDHNHIDPCAVGQVDWPAEAQNPLLVDSLNRGGHGMTQSLQGSPDLPCRVLSLRIGWM